MTYVSLPAAPFKINFRKLFLELGLITTVVLTIILVKVLPGFLAQPFYGSYGEYKYYYRLALDFNPDNGPDANLESKLLDAAGNDRIDFVHRYYNRVALAEYRLKIGQYTEALEDLKKAELMTAEPQHLKFLQSRFMTCYAALDKIEKYDQAATAYAYYEATGVPDDF